MAGTYSDGGRVGQRAGASVGVMMGGTVAGFYHLRNGYGKGDPHGVGVHDGQEAHDSQDIPLGNHEY